MGVHTSEMRAVHREVDGGAWSCGMVAGLINDIPTVQELMDRIMNEATSTIYDRLAGMQ